MKHEVIVTVDAPDGSTIADTVYELEKGLGCYLGELSVKAYRPEVHIVFHTNMGVAKVFADKAAAWKYAADNATDGYLLAVTPYTVEA